MRFRAALKWRWNLPIGHLLLCAFLVAPLWHGFLSELHGSIIAYSGEHASSESPQNRPLILKMDYSEEEERRMRNLERRIWTPAALNFPAGAVTIPVAMFSNTHEEWHPRGMFFEHWRALSWPLMGIVFWWSAGKGLEALLLARRSLILRLSWIHPVLGTWEVLTGGVLFELGLSFSTKMSGDPPPDVVAGSGLLWVVLGATTIAGFWLQRRLSRQAASYLGYRSAAPHG